MPQRLSVISRICWASSGGSFFRLTAGARRALSVPLVFLRIVDPSGDGGRVGSGFEGGLVAGESAFAVLDRLAGLGLLGCLRLCGACRGARVGECFDGGGEPVGGEGPGDPLVQGLAHDVFPQVDCAGVGEAGSSWGVAEQLPPLPLSARRATGARWREGGVQALRSKGPAGRPSRCRLRSDPISSARINSSAEEGI